MTTETTTPNISEFAEYDWYGFAGAEEFPNGGQPLKRQEPTYFAIADRNGVFLSLVDDGGDPVDFHAHIQIASQEHGRMILAMMAPLFTIEFARANGFIEE